uniref:Reverse transcriptase domain-containing protein n=1 Tax=Cacopsylla melanoneura TaxID=428564 RepID=A0A8D8LJW0_9HEMI
MVLTEMYKWFINNNLSLNTSKTFYMPFGKKQTLSQLIPICLTNISITPTPTVEAAAEVRFLGVTLDHNLNWNAHIDKLKSRLGSAIFALKYIRKRIGPDAAKIAYHAYFHSLIDYGLPFWGVNKRINEIFTLQKKALRATLNIKCQRVTCREKFKTNNILTIIGSFIMNTCVLLHKNIDSYPKHIHQHNTRHKENLMIPRIKENSYTYMGVKLYNSLPNDLKQLELKHFKTKIKEMAMDIEPYSIQEFIENIKQCT